MSIEASNLAKRMNKLDLSLQNSKNRKLWEAGKAEYENIKLQITFILPQGLKQVVNFLDENGKVIYERFYKKLIEEEINKIEKKKR